MTASPEQQETGMAVELLCCPFCGSDELSHGAQDSGTGDERGVVQCHVCDAAMLAEWEDEAIAAWNRRAHVVPVYPKEAVERLSSYADWLENEREMTPYVALGAGQKAADLRTLLAHVTAPAMNSRDEWWPIETAPKDGTWVLAHGDGQGWENCTFVCEWAEDLGGYTGWQEVPGDKLAHPTHWMPLPSAPVSAERGQEGEG